MPPKANRIGSLHRCRSYLLERIGVTAQKARPIGTQVVNRTANLRNASASVGIDPNAEIDIRLHVETGQLIQYMPAVDCVHAAYHDVAYRDGAHDVRVKKSPRVECDLGAETHGANRTRSYFDLGARIARILCGGIRDPVEILFLNNVRINEQERAH